MNLSTILGNMGTFQLQTPSGCRWTPRLAVSGGTSMPLWRDEDPTLRCRLSVLEKADYLSRARLPGLHCSRRKIRPAHNFMPPDGRPCRKGVSVCSSLKKLLFLRGSSLVVVSSWVIIQQLRVYPCKFLVFVFVYNGPATGAFVVDFASH
ncbi:hypothetical protein BBK36DRAFT_1142509 [Trichoderma citrinoviride]|uniref:Uncharacterized protein n=1 Tax=Trichoderma citrinoviride TaxID=58853 RepID=A0A2T4B5S5_9HYPO|nr:hypothetical protein BBK36DRAFT_1142509 [Trichoderma citrinoviride]PTB64561.1 hypothetical protein BBK36DRAFT_1142509 [Trichoderma citrinoviride]